MVRLCLIWHFYCFYETGYRFKDTGTEVYKATAVIRMSKVIALGCFLLLAPILLLQLPVFPRILTSRLQKSI